MAPRTVPAAIETSEEQVVPSKVYKVAEVQKEPVLPESPKGRKDARQEIDYRQGPAIVNGYIDAITHEILVDIQILGIKLGKFEGNIRKGVEVKIHITAASGVMRFEVRNGSEAWISQKIAMKFGEYFDREEKLFDIRTHGESILLGQGKEVVLAKL